MNEGPGADVPGFLFILAYKYIGMTDGDLFNRVNQGEYEFHDQIFNYPISINRLYSNKNSKTLTFVNCEFTTTLEILNLEDNSLSLAFFKCKFAHVSIWNCNIHKLLFYNSIYFNDINIGNSTFADVSINGNNTSKDSTLSISYTNITFYFSCYDLCVKSGTFLDLNYDEELTKNLSVNFGNSSFESLNFKANFGRYCSFSKLKVVKSDFNFCSFNEANFNDSNFLSKSNFFKCIFKEDLYFKNSSNQGEILFLKCIFHSFSHFNQSLFNNLNFDNTIFEKRASFDRVEVKNFDLYQTTFSQGAFFDEFKIKSIIENNYFEKLNIENAKTWRRTLRQIKQELQKTENKIDYNRFRTYELAAYYQELNWEHNFRDKFILWATKWSVGFDHSWRKGLAFTLSVGFFWYVILYWLEHRGDCDTSEIEGFFNGFYRFLLVTDFYDPFEHEKRKFLENGWSGLVMIIGKIFIAFGIYEMIQAFRKFKA